LTNTGFTDHSLEDVGHFIARPDGVIAPEPSGMALAAVALTGLLPFWRRRRAFV